MTATARAKPAKQERSELKRDRILGALEELLREKEFAHITVTGIASRAEVSPATVYQRFSNRDAAISILIELYIQRSMDWALSEQGRVDFREAPDLYQALVSVGRSAWRQVEALGYVMRPAYLYSRLRPDLLGETWSETERQAREGFESLLRHFAPDPSPADAVTADMILYFYNFMLIGKLLHDDAPNARGWRVLEDEETYARSLADMAHAYVSRPRGDSR